MSAAYPAGAQYDETAPFNRPSLDARAAREIERKTDDLCAIAFDHLSSDAQEWIWDERDRGEVRDLLFASIRLATNAICPDAAMAHYKAVDALKEIYVRECRHLYRAEAEQDVMEQ